MLDEVDRNLLGLVALFVLWIALALVRLQTGHALGQGTARLRQASVRTIVDVGAAKGFGDYRQRTAIDLDLRMRERED